MYFPHAVPVTATNSMSVCMIYSDKDSAQLYAIGFNISSNDNTRFNPFVYLMSGLNLNTLN